MEIVDLKTDAPTTEKSVSREDIINFEELLALQKNVTYGDNENYPLVHTFSDGIYIRQITIPAGTLLSGKIHKHPHPNFLLEGKVVVATEDGYKTLVAPCSMISKAGTKRALYAVTKLVWTTIHHNPTNTQDLKELEKIVIADSYEKYEKHIANDKKVITKVKKFLIKKLS